MSEKLDTLMKAITDWVNSDAFKNFYKSVEETNRRLSKGE